MNRRQRIRQKKFPWFSKYVSQLFADDPMLEFIITESARRVLFYEDIRIMDWMEDVMHLTIDTISEMIRLYIVENEFDNSYIYDTRVKLMYALEPINIARYNVDIMDNFIATSSETEVNQFFNDIRKNGLLNGFMIFCFTGRNSRGGSIYDMQNRLRRCVEKLPWLRKFDRKSIVTIIQNLPMLSDRILENHDFISNMSFIRDYDLTFEDEDLFEAYGIPLKYLGY